MAKVFLSYRRSDTQLLVGRVVERLEGAGHAVFFDVDTLVGGKNWKEQVRHSISISDVVVALIGKEWISERLFDDTDPVRFEIALSLDLGKPLLPLLVDRAPFPEVADLPTDLRGLRDLHARHLDSGSDFNHQFWRILKNIAALASSAGEPIYKLSSADAGDTLLVTIPAHVFLTTVRHGENSGYIFEWGEQDGDESGCSAYLRSIRRTLSPDSAASQRVLSGDWGWDRYHDIATQRDLDKLDTQLGGISGTLSSDITRPYKLNNICVHSAFDLKGIEKTPDNCDVVLVYCRATQPT